MKYLHDVWVNWFEGEENGYNVCEFHEWKKEDGIDLLDQVPLLNVSEEVFNYIENDLSEIPKDLLNAVYNKAYLRKNHERVRLEYAFVIVSGDRVLVVDTLGYNIPIRKSRLMPRQYEIAIEMVRDSYINEYYIKDNYGKSYHILSLDPKYMIGLTRKERSLKQLLFMALDILGESGNLEEIKYYYIEMNPKAYEWVKDKDFDEIYNAFLNDAYIGWTENHKTVCELLIKGQPFFEKLYEIA